MLGFELLNLLRQRFECFALFICKLASGSRSFDFNWCGCWRGRRVAFLRFFFLLLVEPIFTATDVLLDLAFAFKCDGAGHHVVEETTVVADE